MSRLTLSPLFRLGITSLVLLALALVPLLLLPGCGGGGGSSEVVNLVDKAAEAGININSYRMSLSMFLEYGESGGKKTDEWILEINGNDLHFKDTFYDTQSGQSQVIQEVIRVGGKQYSKDFQSGKWVEEKTSPIEDEIGRAHV